jgi:tripartite-type tricarboxylate transporter receptor subunit TctC
VSRSILLSPRHRLRRSAVAAIGVLFLTPFYAHAAEPTGSAETFYKGRQISLIVGSAPGGGYDAYSRLLARHYAGHIAGRPDIVVQNMNGASGVRAVNYLYNVAARDGSVIAIGQRATLIEPVYGSEQVKIDARKLSWIGGLNTEWSVGVGWHESGLNSLADAREHDFPVSASGATSDGYIYAAVLNNVLGTRFKIIGGYPGNSEEQLAMERGEVAGRIGWAWGSIKATAGDLLEKGLIKPVVLLAPAKQAGFDVPLARDFARTDEDRQILDFVFAPQLLGRPYFGPPDVPADRLATLRDGFAATVQDPAFVADAAKQKLDIQYVPAQDLADLVDRLYATPPAVIAQAKAARANKGADGKLKAARSPNGSATQTATRDPVRSSTN